MTSTRFEHSDGTVLGTTSAAPPGSLTESSTDALHRRGLPNKIELVGELRLEFLEDDVVVDRCRALVAASPGALTVFTSPNSVVSTPGLCTLTATSLFPYFSLKTARCTWATDAAQRRVVPLTKKHLPRLRPVSTSRRRRRAAPPTRQRIDKIRQARQRIGILLWK